jgi:hypothetical protein
VQKPGTAGRGVKALCYGRSYGRWEKRREERREGEGREEEGREGRAGEYWNAAALVPEQGDLEEGRSPVRRDLLCGAEG